MSGELTVSDLAHELKLPASVLLEECHRLGIEAGWAGGILTQREAELLRDRLGPAEGANGPLRRPTASPTTRLPRRAPAGSAGPVAPATSTPPAAPAPDVPSAPSVPSVPSVPPTSGPGAALPPTAVGSMPGMAHGGPSGHEPGPLSHVDRGGRETTEVSNRSLASQGRRFDGTARTAAVAGIVGVVLVAAAPSSPHVLVTVAAWLGAIVAGATALVAGNRSRYKITTHPERLRGMAVAIASMVVGIVVLVGLGLGIWAVVRGAPASEGPAAVTDRTDVAELRWTYQRVSRIAGNGWNRPVKDAGTCWVMPRGDDEPRTDERVELTFESVSCRAAHDGEVLGVFALLPEADVPYPGSDELNAYGRERCASVIDGLPDGGEGVTIVIEYPTEAGWDDADHDVACVAMASRRGSLTETVAEDPASETGN